jgi:hypothetical protein
MFNHEIKVIIRGNSYGDSPAVGFYFQFPIILKFLFVMHSGRERERPGSAISSSLAIRFHPISEVRSGRSQDSKATCALRVCALGVAVRFWRSRGWQAQPPSSPIVPHRPPSAPIGPSSFKTPQRSGAPFFSPGLPTRDTTPRAFLISLNAVTCH